MSRRRQPALQVVAAVALWACQPTSPADPSLLRQARTAEQEARAFEHLRDNAKVLGVIAWDANGKKLKGSESPWGDAVVRITVRVDGEAIEHEVIDRANIPLLIGN